MGSSADVSAQFHGQVRQSRQSGDLGLSLVTYRPSEVVHRHVHSSTFFCLVLEGGFVERAGRAGGRCETGSLLFHPRDEPHAQEFFPLPSRCFLVQFGPRAAARALDHGVPWPTAPAVIGGGHAAWLARMMYDAFGQGDTAAGLAIEGLSLAVLAEVARAATRLRAEPGMPAWLRRARELLDERYLDALTLSEVAAVADVHPVHLSRVFRQRIGITLTGYVRRRRVEHACRELARTDFTIARIAAEAGFSDQGHFSRVFRQVTGMPPSAYRRIARQGRRGALAISA